MFAHPPAAPQPLRVVPADGWAAAPQPGITTTLSGGAPLAPLSHLDPHGQQQQQHPQQQRPQQQRSGGQAHALQPAAAAEGGRGAAGKAGSSSGSQNETDNSSSGSFPPQGVMSRGSSMHTSHLTSCTASTGAPGTPWGPPGARALPHAGGKPLVGFGGVAAELPPLILSPQQQQQQQQQQQGAVLLQPMLPPPPLPPHAQQQQQLLGGAFDAGRPLATHASVNHPCAAAAGGSVGVGPSGYGRGFGGGQPAPPHSAMPGLPPGPAAMAAPSPSMEEEDDAFLAALVQDDGGAGGGAWTLGVAPDAAAAAAAGMQQQGSTASGMTDLHVNPRASLGLLSGGPYGGLAPGGGGGGGSGNGSAGALQLPGGSVGGPGLPGLTTAGSLAGLLGLDAMGKPRTSIDELDITLDDLRDLLGA